MKQEIGMSYGHRVVATRSKLRCPRTEGEEME